MPFFPVGLVGIVLHDKIVVSIDDARTKHLRDFEIGLYHHVSFFFWCHLFNVVSDVFEHISSDQTTSSASFQIDDVVRNQALFSMAITLVVLFVIGLGAFTINNQLKE